MGSAGTHFLPFKSSTTVCDSCPNPPVISKAVLKRIFKKCLTTVCHSMAQTGPLLVDSHDALVECWPGQRESVERAPPPRVARVQHLQRVERSGEATTACLTRNKVINEMHFTCTGSAIGNAIQYPLNIAAYLRILCSLCCLKYAYLLVRTV